MSDKKVIGYRLYTGDGNPLPTCIEWRTSSYVSIADCAIYAYIELRKFPRGRVVKLVAKPKAPLSEIWVLGLVMMAEEIRKSHQWTTCISCHTSLTQNEDGVCYFCQER